MIVEKEKREYLVFAQFVQTRVLHVVAASPEEAARIGLVVGPKNWVASPDLGDGDLLAGEDVLQVIVDDPDDRREWEVDVEQDEGGGLVLGTVTEHVHDEAFNRVTVGRAGRGSRSN